MHFDQLEHQKLQNISRLVNQKYVVLSVREINQ